MQLGKPLTTAHASIRYLSLPNGNIEGRIYDVDCTDADILVAHQVDYFKEKRI